MSADDDSAAAATLESAVAASPEKCCASCGIAQIDDVKLKSCPHCDLVEYCSDECQQDHHKKHEANCKVRAAELYDELLFKQPQSTFMGDCPICFLPMPLLANKSRVKLCCGKQICAGCIHADNLIRKFKDIRCPFCRHLTPETDKEAEKLATERVKVKDPYALRRLAKINDQRGDYESAFKYYSRAASLGDTESMFNLSVMYHNGEGVEVNRAKEKALLEKTAIAGHHKARYNLGCYETEYGRIDRAVRHWIIAATLGCDDSIKALKNCYKHGHSNLSKEDFAAALRAYQDAVDAMKSPQRQAAEEYLQYF